MRRLLPTAAAALALFGAGYLTAQARQAAPATAAPSAQFGAVYCAYTTRTEYLGLNGSYTTVSAVVAEWSNLLRRWQSVPDYQARSAINSSCDRE